MDLGKAISGVPKLYSFRPALPFPALAGPGLDFKRMHWLGLGIDIPVIIYIYRHAAQDMQIVISTNTLPKISLILSKVVGVAVISNHHVQILRAASVSSRQD